MNTRKRFSAGLCLLFLLSLVSGCTWIGTTENAAPPITTAPTTTVPTTTAPVSVQFPLEEELTLVLVTSVSRVIDDLEEILSRNQLWNDLYERTNVRIEVRPYDTVDSLASMLDNSDYGDILFLYSYIDNSFLSDTIHAGKLMDLTAYIGNRDLMPNLNSRVFDESPAAKGIFTWPDGKIYTLGSYGGGAFRYLESTCWINKTWLEAAGMTLEDVSTLDGLERFFAWVENNDANSNGDPSDEVPYGCYQSGNGFIEALLASWGMPTRDQVSDGYCTVENGQVRFVPATDAYRDFLDTMKRWYANGWFYDDYFLGHDGGNRPLYEHWMNTNVRDNGEPERIAFWTSTGAPDRNNGAKLPEGTETCEYVAILPPTVEGFEPRWYMHPAVMGGKGNFAIAANCEHPEIALAWLDLFYSQEVTERVSFGEPGNSSRIEKDGKLGLTTEPGSTLSYLLSDENRLNRIFSSLPSAVTNDEWVNRRILTKTQERMLQAFAIYEPILNTEIWPRPYMTRETSEEYTQLYSSIQQIVSNLKTNWITGSLNTDDDWEQFQKQLKDAGIDRMLMILQEHYNIYLDALE